MGLFSRFFANHSQDQPIDDSAAQALEQAIIEMEALLAASPNDAELHKVLMIKYNQALKAYAKNPHYRHQVDALFVKIDDLRNLMRKNISVKKEHCS